MKNLKILFILILFNLLLFNTTVFAATEPPSLNSEGVVLLDGDTGQVLYSKNEDKTYYPASTTKVLTALVVLENANLSDKVTVGAKPPNAEGTSVGIRVGEVYTVRELIESLLLMSGNDCAEALAEHVSGSTEEFATLMNKKAKEVGCTNSNFVNPSGLPDENHFTTPKDLSLIMKACITNPNFVEISRVQSGKLSPSIIDGNIIEISNHNYLLFSNSRYYYPYSVASKKGYTEAARFTNIISAKKGDTTLVASFLKGPDISTVYSDVATIFNYGFDNYERMTIYSKDKKIAECAIDSDTLPLISSENVYYNVDISKKSNLKPTLKYDIPSDLDLKSITKGDVITTADVIVDGQSIHKLDLLSGVDREPPIKEIISSSIFDDYSKYLIGSAIAIVFLAILRINYVRHKRIRKIRKIRKLKNVKYKKLKLNRNNRGIDSF